jgi:hypothetical protein
MDISLHMDGVGYAGADGRGFLGLMAARPHDRKGYRMRGAFRSSRRPKCTAKACPFPDNGLVEMGLCPHLQPKGYNTSQFVVPESL